MKAVGGFFELEVGAPGAPFHAGALGLCSGRACLARILREVRPARAYVPFFICDAALQPFDTLGVPRTFYRLNPSLEPILPVDLGDDACVLVVNYFGLTRDAVAPIVARGDARVLVDDTQAFFDRGHDGAWSFNSARKFFGVPDGGYAYGAGLRPDERHPAAADIRYDHLINRLLGHQALAFQQYQDSERHVCADVLAMSGLSSRLLAAIDYPRARARRLENFALAHARLASINQRPWPSNPAAGDVPFCYPLLLDHPIDRARLSAQGLFVPVLWPDLRQRADDGFAFERSVADRLLPLPIDHRYEAQDVEWMCDLVSGAR